MYDCVSQLRPKSDEACVHFFDGLCRILLQQNPETPEEKKCFLTLARQCVDLVDVIVEIERKPEAIHLARDIARGRNAYHLLQEKICNVTALFQMR